MEATIPLPPGRRPIEVGRVVSESFAIYRANAVPLLLTALVVFVVAGLIQGLLAGSGFVLQLVAQVVGVAATTLYSGFVVKLVQDVRDGRRDFTVGQLVSSATPFLLPLIVNGFLRGIAVAIGFLLLIIPGLYLLTIWAVTAPAIVIEGEDGIGAFGRSRRLTEGQRMGVFLTIVVVFLITLLASAVLLAVGASIGTGALIPLAILVGVLTAPISAIVSAVLFYDLGGGASSQAASPPPPPL